MGIDVPAATPARPWQLPVVPDKVDLRDRLYQPPVNICPEQRVVPKLTHPVEDQGGTNACTGFALAGLIHALLHRRDGKAGRVSPYMLYDMARRYDEFPGAGDKGSSIRGVLKGWSKHGACAFHLWPGLDMPPPRKDPAEDWWLDSNLRPLGAYYRVDTGSIIDMQIALCQTGAMLASAVCHAGWAQVRTTDSTETLPVIPLQNANAWDGGHAFVILGYDESGFIVQNSWGSGWGARGYAILSYDDWALHAMDCWVAQLGVVTRQHLDAASAITLRTRETGEVVVAQDAMVRLKELSPFILNMENNGRLGSTGKYRTRLSDLKALVDIHLPEAWRRWGIDDAKPMDIALFAHGGRIGEDRGFEIASRWIPDLYSHQIFPIYLMWESDELRSLLFSLQDLVGYEPRMTGGLMEWAKRQWDRRVEGLVSYPGSKFWGEMKENARHVSTPGETGGTLLFNFLKEAGYQHKPIRLHLIGHSAGAIVQIHLAHSMSQQGWRFRSANFMAPAASEALFRETLLPLLRGVTPVVARYTQMNLSETAEQTDPSCRGLLGYSRSLLYLVSEAFEPGSRVPLLGMQTYFGALKAKLESEGLSITHVVAPGPLSGCTEHGHFSTEEKTRRTVIDFIKERL